MAKKKKIDRDIINRIIYDIIHISLIIIFVAIIIALLVGESQAWILYGNKPITEVPMWAVWFLTYRG